MAEIELFKVDREFCAFFSISNLSGKNTDIRFSESYLIVYLSSRVGPTPSLKLVLLASL